MFFALHQMGVALLIVALLLVSIVMFIRHTWTRERRAALLFLPYAGWVCFALVLNTALWWMNH